MMKIQDYLLVESGDRLGLTHVGEPLIVVTIEGAEPKDIVVRDRFREVLKTLASLLNWLDGSDCGYVNIGLDSAMISALRAGAARSILDYAKRIPGGKRYMCGIGRLEEAGDLDALYCDPLRGEWVVAMWRNEVDRRIIASTDPQDCLIPRQLIEPGRDILDEVDGLRERYQSDY